MFLLASPRGIVRVWLDILCFVISCFGNTGIVCILNTHGTYDIRGPKWLSPAGLLSPQVPASWLPPFRGCGWRHVLVRFIRWTALLWHVLIHFIACSYHDSLAGLDNINYPANDHPIALPYSTRQTKRLSWTMQAFARKGAYLLMNGNYMLYILAPA